MQVRPAPADLAPAAANDGKMISHRRDNIRDHSERLINAVPALPAHFRRARDILPVVN